MRDETRIHQIMELINAETDLQKVQVLTGELAQLLSEKSPPVSVYQKSALN